MRIVANGSGSREKPQAPHPLSIDVSHSLDASATAAYAKDFTNWIGIAHFDEGSDRALISISTIGDLQPESTEYLSIRLTASNDSMYRVSQSIVSAAILDILTPDGHKRTEDIKVRDSNLPRPEDRHDGPARTSDVEEVYKLSARTLELRVAGQLIETTGEYPFFIGDQNWGFSVWVHNTYHITKHGDDHFELSHAS